MSTKKMLGGFVVLVSFLGVAATSLAAGPSRGGGGTTPTPTVVAPGPTMQSVNPCPSGWHLQKGTKSGDTYSCQPTKTSKMIQCPPGLVYFDNGCNIGCDKPVY